MGDRVLNYFVNVFILCSFLASGLCQTNLTIDTEADLEAVLFGPHTCTYAETQVELDSCKDGVDGSFKSGFWSSCQARNCEISILVGSLTASGQIPKEISVLTYYGGNGAEIQLRWKRNSEAPVANIETIPFTEAGWFLYTRDLTTLLDFTTDSIIFLRFASNQLPEYDADIADQIIFSFEPESTDPTLPSTVAETTVPSTLAYSTLDTTIEPSPRDTTTGPPSTIDTRIQDVIIDSETDLSPVQIDPTTCTYAETHGDLESCKSGVEDSCSFGFWSSCGANNCEISILIGNLGNHGQVPKKLHVLTYYGGGGAEIRLRWKRTAALPFANIETIPFTQPGWFRYTRDLTTHDFTTESIINLRLASSQLPGFDADIVDQIIFSFEDDSPDPWLPCDVETTTVPISTIEPSTVDTTPSHSTVDTPSPSTIDTTPSPSTLDTPTPDTTVETTANTGTVPTEVTPVRPTTDDYSGTTLPTATETGTPTTPETEPTTESTTEGSTESTPSTEFVSYKPTTRIPVTRPTRPTFAPEPEVDDDNLLEILLFVGGGIAVFGGLVGLRVGLHYYNKSRTGIRRRLID